MAKTKPSTDLSTFMKTAALPDLSDADMAGALAEVVNDTGSGGAITYLSFSGKSGHYALGRNKAEPDPEDIFIIEPQSVITGWTCWKGSKPIGKHEWSAYRPQQAIPERDLEDHGPYRAQHGEGWHKMLGFGMVTTDGVMTSITFSTTSVSGRNSVGDLLEEIRKRAEIGEPLIPAVTLECEEFTAQDQVNYKPVFAVEAWLSRAAATAYSEGKMELDDLMSGKEPRKARSRK